MRLCGAPEKEEEESVPGVHVLQPQVLWRQGSLPLEINRAAPQWQPLRPVPLRVRWSGRGVLALARPRLERFEPRGPLRNYLHFAPAPRVAGAICLVS